MIPTAKSKNFFDLSAGNLHVVRLTRVELDNLINRCPYRKIGDDGAAYYSVPMYEKVYKQLKKTGRVGFDTEQWYNIDEETS